MSRYTGPVNKKSRRLKFSILENNKEFIKGKKRTTSPGQHGDRRQKLSNYGEHLYEKQKVRYMYGLSEKQMINTFKKASKVQGVLGTNFLVMLESRLDNIVYRLGLANTRRQARQFVNHGHILVNGSKIDIPSYQVKPEDVIEVRDKSKSNFFMKDNLGKARKVDFVEFNESEMKGKYLRYPEREEIAHGVNEALIVEFYNK